MKKLILLFLCIALMLTLCACGDDEPVAGPKGDAGEQGPQGEKGDKGESGNDGVGILKTEIIDGCLWITYTSDPENPVNLGRVVESGTDGEEGTPGLEYYPLPDGTYGVMAGTTLYLEEIEIPASYKGKAVTQILPFAFSGYPTNLTNLTNLTKITIPDSIKVIGEYAFFGCGSLTSVAIGSGVTEIGEGAFHGCTGLTSATIPDSVTEISKYAFYNCYKLVEVINKSSLNISVGSSDNGGAGYYALDVHNGSSKIVSKDDYLFITSPNGTNYLLGYVGDETALTLPNDYNGQNYKVINYAFCNKSLTSVTIPDSVTEISKYAFESCTSLTSVTIGNGVTSIGDYAFFYCKSLTSVTIPDSVTEIGDRAFSGCTGLTSVTIGNGVTSIGSSAFDDCSSLTSVTIGSGVTSIGNYAFDGCTGLTQINFNAIAMNDLSSGSNVFYNAGSNGNGIKLVIGKSVTKIPAYLFYSISPKLTSVEFESGSVCESIGACAFYVCESLASVTIPDSVTEIGYQAFLYCSSLTTINYRGSESEWNAISKGEDWDYGLGSYTIIYNYTGE